MNKSQLIDEIRRHNASAEPRFLEQFEEGALRKYLDRLEAAKAKTVHIAGWSHRPGELRKVS